MQKYLYVLMAVALAAIVLSGCDQPGGCNAGRTIALTEADDGRVIEMDLADPIKITLPSNPSTGYSWENVSPEDGIMVQVGASVYVTDPACGNRTGCGGTETFRFNAVRSGTGAIKLIYHRPWSAEEPIDRFEITVIVQ